jgi:hypothetical protein
MNIRKLLFLLTLISTWGVANAQYPVVSIHDIQYVDAVKLAACNDSSSYHGDTVTVIGYVMADANLTDIPSSSVQGGFRPAVHLADTADGGKMGNFSGIQIMGVYLDASKKSLPVNDIFNLYEGMMVKLTGIVSTYAGETQMTPLDNSSMTVLGTGPKPQAVKVDVGKLNDNNRNNLLETGETYEGSFIELTDLTVIAVNPFSGNRVSFDVQDANGNKINVSDRFFVQKTSSYSTTRPSAPVKQGAFVAPVLGTRYSTLKGILLHSANGCLGGTGRGYELNPFDTSHYVVGITPPNVTEITRTPQVPKSTEAAAISAKIFDSDGLITVAEFYYSTDDTDPVASFVKGSLTLKTGTTDEYETSIPAQPNGTIVRYYFRAIDNAANITIVPSTALSAKPNFLFYTVRDNGMSIVDLQKVLDVSADNSPYLGQTVTVTGVVTASAKPYDLEYVFIQDPNFNEWSGIYCTGNSDLIKLYRTEEVIVTGTVQESFGFTTLNVSNVQKTGNKKAINPVTITQNDSAMFDNKQIEKYESMLVQFVNANSGKLKVINPKLSNFGEYVIGADAGATRNASARVQAGVQNSNNNSSLWVSLVSDTTLKTANGEMQVSAVQTANVQTLDTLVGVLTYGFGVWTYKPRNNDDLKGMDPALDKAMYPAIPASVKHFAAAKFNVYPNPVNDRLTVELEASFGPFYGQLVDLSGRVVSTSDQSTSTLQMSTSQLKAGVYLLQVRNQNGALLGVQKIVKN